MLFWALPASGQINMRKVDVGKPLPQSPSISQLTSQLDPIPRFLLFRPPLMTAYRLRFRRVPNPDVTVGLRKAL
jgi:hypothetical protein